MVGDWMGVKILINNNGSFTDESQKLGLADTEGWWHRVVASDVDGDGNIDFILGNHGLNSFFKASAAKPVTMYVNDFDLNGTIEQIICTYNGDKSYPVAMKDELVSQIPSLSSKYKKFADYTEQTINDIFPEEVLKRSVVLKAAYMQSCVMLNNGKGAFKLEPLPMEAQFSPVYAIMAGDFDRDGICDIIVGGNQLRAKPQTGIYDASYGLFMKGLPGKKWQAVAALSSGISVKGEIRDLKILKIKGESILTVARNNDNFQFYKY
jgi:hypothetical protein